MFTNCRRGCALARRCFNMVEVVLALVVIIIGVIGVMTLFPVGLEANRQSVGRSNAADAADQFLHFFATQVNRDWNTLQAFPDSRPIADDKAVVWSAGSIIADAKLSINFATNGTPSETFSAIDHTSGIFRLKQVSAGNVTDFDGVMRAWKVLTTYGTDLAAARDVSLLVEVSWPAEIPYAQRDKQTHRLLMFKPGIVVGTGSAMGTPLPPVTPLSPDASLSLLLNGSPRMSENGGTINATVVRVNAPTTLPEVVTLSSNDTSEAVTPATVTIPAGATSVSFIVTGVDDPDIDGDQTVTLSATSSIGDDSKQVVVLDDDVEGGGEPEGPAAGGAGTLELVIAQPSINENGGSTNATVIRHTTDISAAALVILGNSDTTEASTPSSVIIAAGSTSASFVIHAVDDDEVDGDQVVTISANSNGLGSSSKQVTVLDDDQGSLELTTATTSMSENGGAIAATVHRLDTPLTASLLVTLSSNDTSEATVPATVIIPAGASSVNFIITAVDDALLDGPQPVTITASATDFNNASKGITVTDDDGGAEVPDLVLEDDGNGNCSVVQFSVARFCWTLANGTVLRGSINYTVTRNAAGVAESVSWSSTGDPRVTGAVNLLTNTAVASLQYSEGGVTKTATLNDSNVNNSACECTPAAPEGAAPALELTVDKEVLREDLTEGTPGIVWRRNADNSADLTVTLGVNDATELALGQTTVVIPAGADHVAVTLLASAVQDFEVDGNQEARVTATAAGHNDCWKAITVVDSELASPYLTLTPDKTSLAEVGTETTGGTLTRVSTDISAALIVTLSSNDTTELITLLGTAVIPAGAASVHVDLLAGAVEDFVADGDQTAVLSGAATGYTTASALLNIIDSGKTGPYLTITPSKDSLKEDGEECTDAVITRHGGDLSKQLKVTLTVLDETELSLTQITVTIPAGQSSITVADLICAVEDTVADGNQVSTVTASANGYLDGTTDITVVDSRNNLGGILNINPNNSGQDDFEFTLTKAGGGTITRDDLHAGTVTSYTGGATVIVVKPKGNGNQNGMTLDGAPYDLENKNKYTIASSDMQVKLYNDKFDSNGKAMGHWWIDITAKNATITLNP